MTSFRRILCPVDFSETSCHACELASTLAQQFGAELTLLHVVEEVPLYTAYTGRPEMNAFAEMEKSAKAEMSKLVRGANVRTVVTRGKDFQVIVEYAEAHQVDLIVIGKHGRSKLDYWLFGSVTERVIRRAHCPVVVVPSPPAKAHA